MTSDVGIKAGMVLDHLGTPAEISAFFSLIDRHKLRSSDGKLELVTDRLFKRTVPGEQFDALEMQLAESRNILRKVSVDAGFWDEFHLGDRTTKLDKSAATVGDAFARVYDALTEAIKVARADAELLGYIRPVRLQAWEGTKSHEHGFMEPEDFEKPDMKPIWLE